MSLSPVLKPAPDDDKVSLLSEDVGNDVLDDNKSYPAAKAGQSQLAVPIPGFRSASPDALSNLSIDDWNRLRRGRSRSPARLSVPRQRHASLSPAPPRTWKGRILGFWTRNKGLALVLLSQVFGTLMNVTTRLLEIEGNNGKGMHPFQILFARMGITLVLSSVYMWYKSIKHFPLGAKEVRPLLLARGFGGFFGVFGMYYSLLYLPLADATVITFLAPSLACWACSFLIKEPFTRMEQVAALISLFGVVLIARPASLFSGGGNDAPPASGDGDMAPAATNATSPTTPDAGDYSHVTPAQRAGAVGIAMLGVFGAACAYTTIRWIGQRAHPLISVNYFAAWCTLVSIVMMLALPGVGFLLPADLKEWGYLFFLGICGFAMQFLLSAGLAYEKSSRATNMVYTQMLFALAFDKLVWGTTPGILSIIGSCLILGSAIYVAVQKEKAKPEKEAPRAEEERGFLEDMEGQGLEGRALGNVEMERMGSVGGPSEERSLQEVQIRTMRN